MIGVINYRVLQWPLSKVSHKHTHTSCHTQRTQKLVCACVCVGLRLVVHKGRCLGTL
jgi:hypothetical protein